MSWARSPSLGPGGMLGDRPSRAWFIDRPLWCIARRGGEKAKVIFPLTLKQHLSAFLTCGGNLRILSEELSVWAGELDTLLLRWDDGWLPGLRWSSKEGAGEGLSCTRSCNPCNHKNHNSKIKIQLQLAHTGEQSLFPLLKVTFITEVTILEGRLWPCAAAAMFAMVLRWFIWLIAMVTEAGGRLTGIRGCGIIMKGSSRPETHEEVVDYSMMRIMAEIFTGESCEDLTGKLFHSAASNSHCHEAIKHSVLWWTGKKMESFKWVTC